MLYMIIMFDIHVIYDCLTIFNWYDLCLYLMIVFFVHVHINPVQVRPGEVPKAAPEAGPYNDGPCMLRDGESKSIGTAWIYFVILYLYSTSFKVTSFGP